VDCYKRNQYKGVNRCSKWGAMSYM